MQADLRGYFLGAPDLVIEVLSPPNTMSEILDKEQLCLENGASEFWVVDFNHRQVRISAADSITAYHVGERIPLRPFGDATLTVGDIFEPP
jgi:Uma2 family endonuclease